MHWWPCRFGVALLLLTVVTIAHADQWPQWLGPQRDGVYREAGVVTAIPTAGLPVKWTAKIAHGYAGPAVAGGKVFLFDYLITDGELGYHPSRPDQLSGEERLTAYDAITGKQLWQKSYSRDYAVSYGGGPRCTPTVDGELVYTLGAEGDLVCRQVADGAEVWRKNFRQQYGAVTPIWGHSAHPLVFGDLLICVAGGEGSVAVAFDKRTGEERWKNLTAGEPGYCPPTLIEHNGGRQLLIWHPENLNALTPETGKLIWSFPAQPLYGMAIGAPQKLGDKLFISAIGNVSVLMQLKPDGSDVETLWAGGPKSAVRTANMTAVMTPGAIYGVDCETSELIAVSLTDGQRLWATKAPVTDSPRGRHGTAFLVRHQPPGGDVNQFFIFNEQGELITAQLTPHAYTETGRMKVLEPTSYTFGRSVVWSHPAFADKALFARNDKQLVCVDLSE